MGETSGVCFGEAKSRLGRIGAAFALVGEESVVKR